MTQKKRHLVRIPSWIVNEVYRGTKFAGKHYGVIFRIRNNKQQYYAAVNKIHNTVK